MRLIESVQFDTVYHEHFSYFSLVTAGEVFARHGLRVFDVEELPTHGGSLRLYVAHEAGGRPVSPAVRELERRESDAGMRSLETYAAFPRKVEEAKRSLVSFLTAAKRGGKKVCGYAAPAKATTLLNYCDIGRDLLAFTVDVSPHKQGRFIPGPAIPIYEPARLPEARPDHVVLFAWNLAAEIVPQLGCLREWGGTVVLPLPRTQVLE